MAGSESSREGEEAREGEEVGGESVKVVSVNDEEVLKKVTDVVKAVMELSNRVSLSPPDEYLDLVKVSHMTCHMIS